MQKQELQRKEEKKPSHEEMSQMLKKMGEVSENDSEKYLQNLIYFLKTATKLGVPHKFAKCQSNPSQNKLTLLAIGEVGNGKSTAQNWIMYKYASLMGLPYSQKDHHFKAKNGQKGVTLFTDSIQLGNLRVIDSPGNNDKEIPDAIISDQIVQFFRKILFDPTQGLSGIFQCFMVSKGGRITDSSIRPLSRLLLNLTYSYPEFQTNQSFPRLNIIFTDFSRYQQEQSNNNNNFGPQDDIDEEEEQRTSQTNESKLPQMIEEFKKKLVLQIKNEIDGKQSESAIRKKVDIFLPKNNFYTFKLMKQQEEMEKELKQIHQLIEDNILHGHHYISNQQDSLLEPVKIDYELRQSIQEHIQDIINFCVKELEKSQQIYIQFSNRYPSPLINQFLNQMNQVNQSFKNLIQECPYALSKTPSEFIEVIRIYIEKFSYHAQNIALKEIAQVNKEEALKAEKRQKEHQKQIQKFQQELEKGRKEQQEAQRKYEENLEDLISKQEENQKQHNQQMTEMQQQIVEDQREYRNQLSSVQDSLSRSQEQNSELQEKIIRMSSHQCDSGCTLI